MVLLFANPNLNMDCRFRRHLMNIFPLLLYALISFAFLLILLQSPWIHKKQEQKEVKEEKEKGNENILFESSPPSIDVKAAPYFWTKKMDIKEPLNKTTSRKDFQGIKRKDSLNLSAQKLNSFSKGRLDDLECFPLSADKIDYSNCRPTRFGQNREVSATENGILLSKQTGKDKKDRNNERTEVRHLQFGVASSSKTWLRRAAFVRAWWNVSEVRGHVWMDTLPEKIQERDPKFQVSSYKSRFPHARLAHMVVEAFRLNLPNVRWFVFGDDDTFFSPHGIAALLNKYDHTEMMNIGSQSETHWQNSIVSHEIAFGGGGYAISFPLAAALNGTLDECMERYDDIWVSDYLVGACIRELGVHVTRERGFHQCDLHGSVSGLMESHFLEVFASLHHVEMLLPLVPPVVDRIAAIRHLSKSIRPDPVGFSQQTICYDPIGSNWTVSIAWGYSAKFYPKIRRFTDLEKVERTFSTFVGDWDPQAYDLDTRKVEPIPQSGELCGIPFAMYISKVESLQDGSVQSIFERFNVNNDDDIDRKPCEIDVTRMTFLKVVRKSPMEVPISKNGLSSGPNLRRQCCDKISFEEIDEKIVGSIVIGDCESRET